MRDTRSVEIATKVALSFLGLPYKWGGDDPLVGFDCSGFIIEILKSVGYLPRSGDWRAQDLYNRFNQNSFSVAEEGCLVFWHNNISTLPPYNIIHVEYCLGRELSIGASGGGGSTMTEADAVEQNAYIKIRPFRSRQNLVNNFIDPFLI
jgi:cell wall-associated NlpC family hydrolase